MEKSEPLGNENTKGLPKRIAPIAFNQNLRKANLLTAFCVNHLAVKYDRITRWPFGFYSLNRSCSYGDRFQCGGSWPASQNVFSGDNVYLRH
jgi:hypothetical protein